jgi:hypothetical protein
VEKKKKKSIKFPRTSKVSVNITPTEKWMVVEIYDTRRKTKQKEESVKLNNNG